MPNDNVLTDSDVFTLIGHAELLRGRGETDMPAWCLGLAHRIALGIDEAFAARVEALATKHEQTAAHPGQPEPRAVTDSYEVDHGTHVEWRPIYNEPELHAEVTDAKPKGMSRAQTRKFSQALHSLANWHRDYVESELNQFVDVLVEKKVLTDERNVDLTLQSVMGLHSDVYHAIYGMWSRNPDKACWLAFYDALEGIAQHANQLLIERCPGYVPRFAELRRPR